MDESGYKGLEVKGANRESREIGRIMARGYDRGLRRGDVKSALRKLYSSCGEVTDVYVPRVRKSLWHMAYIYFVREGAVDKALKLNGSDMGGWTVDAQDFPFPEKDNNCSELEVMGYDTSLSESDLKCELTKLFSSCGKIVDLDIYKSFSTVFLVGEDAAEKAPKLSGSDMGGHKVFVSLVRYLGKTTTHRREPIISGRPPNKKAKMTLGVECWKEMLFQKDDGGLEIDGNMLQEAHIATLNILRDSHDLKKFPALKAELSMRQPLCLQGD